MVIKVDVGIESVLVLDDELVVVMCKFVVVQCICWLFDSLGSQIIMELLSRMVWLEKKVIVKEMMYDRFMNFLIWIMSDGKVYVVQWLNLNQKLSEFDELLDFKKLFKGYCFYVLSIEQYYVVWCVINVWFLLIVVSCVDGIVCVYLVCDYFGNILFFYIYSVFVFFGVLGKFIMLSYLLDGYCLFVGYEKGWVMWSVYGKLFSSSFYVDYLIVLINGEEWFFGVLDVVWVGGVCELFLINKNYDVIWFLEMV